MPLTSNLTRTTVVAGMLEGTRTLIRRRRTVDVIGRGQRSGLGAHACGRRRKRPYRCFARAIRLLPLASPTMVVTAMTHSTPTPAEGEKCERAYAKREPNPVTAKPVHRAAPSVSGTVLVAPRITKTRNLPSGTDYR